MSESILEDIINKTNTKIIYVYDFFNMWTFLVELGEIVEENTGTDYPNLLFVKGQIPNEAPQINFEIEASENFDRPNEDIDGGGFESLDTEENWN